MFARSYFPGRTGQLLIVPREGDFITRPDPDVPYMHGSPWAYDVAIPLIFVGPAVRAGTYSMPAVQQDVAPTLAAALGVHMPPTSTGRVLPVLKTDMARPRVVVLIVLDGMRRDYFDRYATLIPTLTTLRQQWGLVHSGAAEYSSVEYRGGALDHCHRNRTRHTWDNR
jgi:arylsulfatase A-like enzyme